MKRILTSIVTLGVLFFGAASAAASESVSAYLVGAYMQADLVKSRLQEAGFEVVASYSPVREGTTLVFTNSALKAEGAKPKRAHAAVLRAFIDEREKMISFTNPLYFGKAFMQDEYKHSVFSAQFEKINSAFAGLTPSKDKLQFDDLADFHFMVGMPYYKDVDVLAEGKNGELIAKAKAYQGSKELVFELKLSENSTLLGYDLGRRTKKFVKKIGRANAAVLPYCISVESGVATALAPKYYLAISYPLLSMGEFMTISTVPGAIIKELQRAFQ